MFNANPGAPAQPASAQGVSSAYASAVLLTLTNPATILYYVAVFAGLGLANSETTGSRASVLVSGVFIGSAVWWLFLVGLVSRFRRFLTPTRRVWINRFSGSILMAFGALAIFSIR